MIDVLIAGAVATALFVVVFGAAQFFTYLDARHMKEYRKQREYELACFDEDLRVAKYKAWAASRHYPNKVRKVKHD